MITEARILVTGSRGFVGSHLMRQLKAEGYEKVFGCSSTEFDLRRQSDVKDLFESLQPTIVIHLAAACGGIGANQDNPGKFFYENAIMGLNVIDRASRSSIVNNFILLGTICSYPKFTPIPFKEHDLWNGYPEETNAPYGIAKKALITMLEAYRQSYDLRSVCLLPANMYGPGDNFEARTSHVIPALILKFIEAKERGWDKVVLWGTGTPTREFLFVRDCCKAIIKALPIQDIKGPVNIGTGHEISIIDLAAKISKLVGFEGGIEYDLTKPDGQPRRSLDTSKAQELLDWKAETDLETGLIETIELFKKTKIIYYKKEP